jgi:hypothetical protein
LGLFLAVCVNKFPASPALQNHRVAPLGSRCWTYNTSISVIYAPAPARLQFSTNLMALVSGPGRGGATACDLPEELQLFVDKHVRYIQSLDTVRT